MLDKLLSSVKFASDVMQSLCYATVLQCGGTGGFVSIAGWDYFDAVVGSYRDKRKGNNKDAIRLWEYPVLDRGQSAVVRGVSIYNSHHGWKIGVDRCSIAVSDFQIVSQKNISIAYPVYHACLKIEDMSQDNDQLTGVLTRRRFFWDIKANIATAKKINIPLYILYIDLNNFKTVNDYFGHDVGDRVLASMSQEIKSVVSGYGTLYRVGGDEFVAAIFGIDEAKALELARRIEMVTEQAPCGVFVNASVGIKRYNNTYGDGDKAVENILKESEADMYAVKKNKKKSSIVCENCSYKGEKIWTGSK